MHGVREEDNAQPDRGDTGTLPAASGAEGDDPPVGEPTLPLSFGTGASAVSEAQNAKTNLEVAEIGGGIAIDRVPHHWIRHSGSQFNRETAQDIKYKGSMM